MSELLPHIQLETGKNPNHAIIWLHGLGADGEDFVPVVDEMNLPVPVRYIFPHAPKRPVTLNGGFVMRAWYDVYAAAPNGGLGLARGRAQGGGGGRTGPPPQEAPPHDPGESAGAGGRRHYIAPLGVQRQPLFTGVGGDPVDGYSGTVPGHGVETAAREQSAVGTQAAGEVQRPAPLRQQMLELLQ